MRIFTTLLLTICFSIPAFSFGKAKSDKPRSDQEVRTIVRRKAPFWLHEGELIVRLNKDGTFASANARVTEGNWKVENAHLKLVWKADKREKVYPVAIANRLPVIAGASLKDGKFSIETPSTRGFEQLKHRFLLKISPTFISSGVGVQLE